MSVTLSAVISHELTPAEVADLWRTIDRENAPQLAAAVFALNSVLWSNHDELNAAYRWEPDPVGATAAKVQALWQTRSDIMHLQNASGIWLNLGAQQCEIALNVLWRWFLTDANIRVAVRGVATEVARLFGAKHIVYLPDSQLPASGGQNFVYRGESFETMMAWLRHNSEECDLAQLPRVEPAGSFKWWEENRYYSERLVAVG